MVTKANVDVCEVVTVRCASGWVVRKSSGDNQQSTLQDTSEHNMHPLRVHKCYLIVIFYLFRCIVCAFLNRDNVTQVTGQWEETRVENTAKMVIRDFALVSLTKLPLSIRCISGIIRMHNY